MIEHTITIDKALVSGLVSSKVELNAEGLESCIGFEPTPFGLFTSTNIVQIPGTVHEGLLPQHLFLRGIKLLITEDAIYKWNADISANTKLLDISTTSPYHVADFGKYFILSNEDQVLVYSDLGVLSVHNPLDGDFPDFATCGNYRGQLVAGYIQSDWHECSVEHYIWSNIGSINCNVTQENTAGFAAFPYGGDVLYTDELTDYMLIYGEYGIIAIKGVTAPAATFAMKMISPIGPLNRNAVASDNNMHVFIGSDHSLYTVVDGGYGKVNVIKLGYDRYFKDWDDDNTTACVFNNPVSYQFSDGNKGYGVYTGVGDAPVVVGAKELCTSAEYITGSMVGTSITLDNTEIITAPFDGNQRGLKTLTTVEVGITGVKIQVAVSALDFDGNWNKTEYINTDNGTCFPRISGIAFKIHVKVISGTGAIKYITNKIQLEDKRALRGKYNVN